MDVSPMSTGGLFDAQQPFAPYQGRIPPIVPGPFDAPLVCVQVNETWMTAIIGSCSCLMAASTWDSDDENTVRTLVDNARILIQGLMELSACPMPVTFRVDPSDPHYWDYSNDGGATWTRQPDTVVHFTPSFIVSGAPSGYDESVNGGLSQTPIPLLVATDPDAVITDPGTLTRNLITASGSVEGLLIQALAQLGVVLIKNNGVAAWFAKIPGLGLANEAVVQIAGGGDYTFPLLEVPDA